MEIEEPDRQAQSPARAAPETITVRTARRGIDKRTGSVLGNPGMTAEGGQTPRSAARIFSSLPDCFIAWKLAAAFRLRMERIKMTSQQSRPKETAYP